MPKWHANILAVSNGIVAEIFLAKIAIVHVFSLFCFAQFCSELILLMLRPLSTLVLLLMMSL